MSGTGLQKRDPEDLTPHPKNDDIYADEAEEWFVNNVEEKGVLEPVVITQNSHFEDSDIEVIISGHRRIDAAKKAQGINEVPVRFEEYETAAEELEVLIDYNQQREKNFSQKMREALEMESVEHIRANGRQGTRTDLEQNFGGGQFGKTAEKVAEMVGFGNRETYRQARKVWNWKEEGYAWAEELVEQLDAGEESVYGAYQETEKMEERLKNRERVQWAEIEELDRFYTGTDLVPIFEELMEDTRNDDWWPMAAGLYGKLEDQHDDFDGGFHFTTDRGKYEVVQVFLYLLENDGTVTLEGDISTSNEPASLVDRKPDASTLGELYWDEEMGRGEIGFRYDVHLLLVELWMWEEDVPLRRGILPQQFQERIDEMRGEMEDTDSE